LRQYPKLTLTFDRLDNPTWSYPTKFPCPCTFATCISSFQPSIIWSTGCVRVREKERKWERVHVVVSKIPPDILFQCPCNPLYRKRKTIMFINSLFIDVFTERKWNCFWVFCQFDWPMQINHWHTHICSHKTMKNQFPFLSPALSLYRPLALSLLYFN
jgi:hypothetical protein